MRLVIFKYRELLIELTKREIKQRYKQSILGYAWVILNPLFQMLVMAFVFSLILRIEGINIPYSLFLYAGLLPWTMFSTSVQSATSSLVFNAGLLTKIYFPRDVFITSTILSKLVDFLLASIIFIGFMIYYKVPLTWHFLWLAPLLSIQILFTYGISLITSSVNLFYRDVQYVVNLFLIVWMYLTPVIYPSTNFPQKYQWIFIANPLAALINGYREVLFNNSPPALVPLLSSLIISIVFAIIGKSIFLHLEGKFADVV